jgi:glutamine synthetase
VDALQELATPEHIQMFQKYGVLSEREVHSRADIYLERYCKDINSESKLCLSLAKQFVLPAAYRYQGELASTSASLKTIGKTPDTSSLNEVTDLVAQLESRIKGLEAAIGHESKGGILDHAKHFRDEVIPAMSLVRETADKLETIVADDLWPLPTYREMLFIR